MPKWNPMQEKAIYTQDKNILVSASAGSGKTTVLIARLLHLIRDLKMDITSILAMTFTEAAANEMKKRLAKALQDALATCEANETAYLQSQLANLSNAHISTIHGFCLEIIQNYYYTIGLDKKRVGNIMDDTKQNMLFSKAMKQTRNTYMNDETFQTLCSIFSSRAESTQLLEDAIIRLFHLANSKSDPKAFLKACQSNTDITHINDLDDTTLFYFYDYLSVQLECILHAATTMKQILEDDDLLILEKKLTALHQCETSLQNKDYQTFREVLLAQSKLILPAIKDNDTSKQLKKEIETIENDLHAILFTENEWVSFTNHMRPYKNMMAELCTCFLTHYEALKEETKGIDFSDMEHYALAILKANDGLVASLYRNKFNEIMVDEFQDSNDVQDELVSLISKSNNVFRVGDIKQSIYGFRHATPAIMRSLIENQKEQDEVIYLSNNYRSKQSIIDFNNYLFNTLMNIEGFDSRFSEYDYTSSGLDLQKENCSPIVFHAIDDKALKEEVSLSKDELKASYIAKSIMQLKESKGYNFKDFVVLIKTNAKADFLKKAFEESNIPYFINMKHGFYNSSAILQVVTFLKAINNPYDDISLCALLLSFFYQLHDHDLVDAKLNKKPNESYYEYFKQHTNLLDTFETLRQKAKYHALSEILSDIYAMNNYYEIATTKQEKSNLDKLFEIVVQMETNNHISITTFLDELSQSKDVQIGEAIPIGSNDDVVRVMSIHQSKGLQFPVVFIYSTSSINLLDTKGLFSADDTLHIAMNHITLPYRLTYPTIERIAFNHKTTKAALEEEMRVLYVATTRAQQEMHIVECMSNKEIPALNRSEIYKKKGFSYWIMQTFKNHATLDFKVEYIDQFWEVQPYEKATKKIRNIPKYAYTIKAETTIAPSEYEFNFTPHTFSLWEDTAMERGSMLHRMSEILPHHTITKDVIKSTAEKQGFQLSTHDEDVLMNLYENPIYLDSFHGEVHHEFPFIVNQDDTILHGYMDYISIMHDKVILIDFKSDRGIDEKTLISRYQKQVSAYQDALHILYPDTPIETYIYSFELAKMIPIL